MALAETFRAFAEEHGFKAGSFRILKKADALKALDLIAKSGAAVLGADVVRNTQADYPDYVSGELFDSEPLGPNEDFEAFAARTVHQTRRFVENYPDSLDDSIGFLLTVADEPEYAKLRSNQP